MKRLIQQAEALNNKYRELVSMETDLRYNAIQLLRKAADHVIAVKKLLPDTSGCIAVYLNNDVKINDALPLNHLYVGPIGFVQCYINDKDRTIVRDCDLTLPTIFNLVQSLEQMYG